MLDKAHIEQWNEFLQERIPIPSEVTRAGKHTCSCVEKEHDSTCVYSCAKCVSYLDCVCATLGTCICLSICTCRCSKCHRKEKAVVDCAVPCCLSPATGLCKVEPLCHGHGDQYRRLLERDRRREIFEQNVVNTIELVKSNKQKFEVIDKDVCLKPGCPDVVHSTRLYGNFCSEVCKSNRQVSQPLYRPCMFVSVPEWAVIPVYRGAQTTTNFVRVFAYTIPKGALQSLPPVLAARDLSSEHNENKVCARSLCNIETPNQSICCSKVCRLGLEDEPFSQQSAISILVVDTNVEIRRPRLSKVSTE